MYLFKGDCVPSLYAKILETVLNEGINIGPRGLLTKELSPVCIEITNPRQRLFGHPHRKEVSIFTYIEGLWILLKEASVDRLVHYVPAMANFTHENTKFLDGAYGPAIGNQLEEVYNRLKADTDTRQAIVIINQPQLHHLPTKDYPCTLSFQFLIRNKKLDMIATMRSQDAWLGLVYDTGEFQWFQSILAGWLGVEVGRYIHIDGSLHLYEKDFVKAKEVIDNDGSFNLYDKAEVLDERVPKEDFDIMLKNLALWEECWRIDKLIPTDIDIYFKNKFYHNLASIIMAYNLRLQGKKNEAYWIVQGGKSDLAIIYEQRWRQNK